MTIVIITTRICFYPSLVERCLSFFLTLPYNINTIKYTNTCCGAVVQGHTLVFSSEGESKEPAEGVGGGVGGLGFHSHI